MSCLLSLAKFEHVREECEQVFKTSPPLCINDKDPKRFPKRGTLGIARCPVTDEALRIRVEEVQAHDKFDTLVRYVEISWQISLLLRHFCLFIKGYVHRRGSLQMVKSVFSATYQKYDCENH